MSKHTILARQMLATSILRSWEVSYQLWEDGKAASPSVRDLAHNAVELSGRDPYIRVVLVDWIAGHIDQRNSLGIPLGQVADEVAGFLR